MTQKIGANLERVRKWVSDAVADGWSIEPTYSKHEVVESAAELKRDGFVAMALMRVKGTPLAPDSTVAHRMDEAVLSVWGPDGLAIEVPSEYSMDALLHGLKVCSNCKGEFEKTIRVGFAGRVCPDCRKLLAPKIEYPGWCE